MNGVEYNRILAAATATTLIDLHLELLNLLLDVVLDNLHSLNDDVFEDPLSLLDVHGILIGVVAKLALEVLEQLVVHSVLAVKSLVHMAGTCAGSQLVRC